MAFRGNWDYFRMNKPKYQNLLRLYLNSRVSSPGEFHPEALVEPYMSLSTHTAPKLFSEQGRVVLEKLSLAPWASRRRQELLELLDRMSPTLRS